jgi:hypothetical protein
MSCRSWCGCSPGRPTEAARSKTWKTPAGVTVPLRPELVLVSPGATSPLLALVAISRRVRAVGLRQVHGGPPPMPRLPDPAAQRRWCTPSARATSPTAGPPPPAPPPAPAPRSDPSTTTRHPPGRPTRRRASAGSAWVSAHPRSRPSPAACSHPLAPRSSAGLAASRSASPCSARQACRRRWPPARSWQWAWAGGWQATPAPQPSPRSAPAQGGGQPHRPAAAPRR